MFFPPVNNILFLDIETVPQYASYAELPEEWKALWHLKAQFLLRNKEEETVETIYNRAGIYSEFGKIVCISVGIIQGYNRSKPIPFKKPGTVKYSCNHHPNMTGKIIVK